MNELMKDKESKAQLTVSQRTLIERYRRAVNYLTAARNPKAAAKAEALILKYERKIADHGIFIRREGVDPPEIAGWRWSN